MHQTAEIFKRETTNAVDDPSHPLAIDVPDGFLHEWWLTFHDIFCSQNDQTFEATTMEEMVESFMETGHQSIGTSVGRHRASLTTKGENLTSSMNWPPAGDTEIPQILSMSQCQRGLPKSISRTPYQQGFPTPTSGPMYSAGNLFSLGPQGGRYSAHLGMENMALHEGAAKIPKLCPSPQHQQLIPPCIPWTSYHTTTPDVDNSFHTKGPTLIPHGIENYVLNSFWESEQYHTELGEKSLSVEDHNYGMGSSANLSDDKSYKKGSSSNSQFGIGSQSIPDVAAYSCLEASEPHNAKTSSSDSHDIDSEANDSHTNSQRCSLPLKHSFY